MTFIVATFVASLSAGQTSTVPALAPPPCVASQLRLSADGGDGRFAAMQKSGTELSIRNRGGDCMLPALPRIDFLDVRGRALPVNRAGPAGLHLRPVVISVELAGGHRAATDLSWIAGPVFVKNQPLRVAYVRVMIGGGILRTRLAKLVYTQPGRGASFSQPPLRAMEGMAAG